MLAKMEKDDVIRPSSSPWASPVVLVQKRDGTLRFCVDYRKINEVTTKDAYPLPRVDDTLNTLAGSQWFTTLDLLSGYWQVEVAEQHREKTAFCTSEGLYEFNVMPFGLCNAPATFQRLMDLILAGLDWDQCMVYIDDIIVLGATFTSHLHNLQAVFQRLRKANLKLHPQKCSFLRSKVGFLGHVVSREGVSADPSKTEKVANWPVPTSTKEVQQFLGLAGYYRRFVKGFADIARPLHRLTERNAVFLWTCECQTAFDTLRVALTSAPILAYPDYTRPFILDTDASNSGIGGVLSQRDADGEEKVIAYASRALSKPERNYCVTRRELLAAVHFTKHFRLYLLGRSFTLRTDHGSLTWLRNFKEPDGQLARWMEHLQQFQFEIVHRPGRQHQNADALSRHPCNQCGRCTSENGTPVNMVALSRPNGDLQEKQLQDDLTGLFLRAEKTNSKPSNQQAQPLSPQARRLLQIWDQLVIYQGLLYRQFEKPDEEAVTLQLVLPASLREEAIRDLHEGAMGGHLGEDKTLGRVKERFYWPGYHNDVCEWIKRCGQCAARKTPAPKNRAPLQSVKTGYPMQLVAVDILGPLPESDAGNSYILMVADYFTRWMEAYPIPNQEAHTVAKKITEEFFFRFSPLNSSTLTKAASLSQC